jgi:hypothetical protein
MSKFLKQVNKGMKKAGKAVAEGVEDLALSAEVEKITEKIESRIEEFDFSSAASIDELTARFDKWRTGSLGRFDDKHDLQDPKVINQRQNLTSTLDEMLERFQAAYNIFVETVLRESTDHVRDQKKDISEKLPLPQHILQAQVDALATSTWKIFHQSREDAKPGKKEGGDGEASEAVPADPPATNALVVKLEEMLHTATLDIHEANKQAVIAGVGRYCESFGYSAAVTISRIA